MVLSSLTVVVAFNAAGAVLVVALMIVPAATALLVTHSQGAMLTVTLLVALISSQVGFWVAYNFNTATSPTMAFVDGLIFLAVWWWSDCGPARSLATPLRVQLGRHPHQLRILVLRGGDGQLQGEHVSHINLLGGSPAHSSG